MHKISFPGEKNMSCLEVSEKYLCHVAGDQTELQSANETNIVLQDVSTF